jgi:hypothetical protein
MGNTICIQSEHICIAICGHIALLFIQHKLSDFSKNAEIEWYAICTKSAGQWKCNIIQFRFNFVLPTISSRGKRCIYSLKCPVSCDHPASFSIGTGGSSLGAKCPKHVVGHTSPSSAQAKSKWSYTSTSPVWLHGIDRGNYLLLMWTACCLQLTKGPASSAAKLKNPFACKVCITINWYLLISAWLKILNTLYTPTHTSMNEGLFVGVLHTFQSQEPSYRLWTPKIIKLTAFSIKQFNFIKKKWNWKKQSNCV